ASKLSYTLWGSMPDDELLAAASDGLDDARFRGELERMVDDPRTSDYLWRFYGEHFGIDNWSADPSPSAFPAWEPGVGDSMIREVRVLVDDALADDGNIGTILTSNEAWVDAPLARLYGLDIEPGQERVALPEGRAGLLTRVGFLASQSSGGQPDPIHRGLFVTLRLLCRELPSPPNLDFAAFEFVGATNRERVESVTHQPGCASCHERLINPPGFMLEHFDAIGRLREEDGGFAVNPTATMSLPDGSDVTLTGGVALSEFLADRPEVHACFTRRLFEFRSGRLVTEADEGLLQDLTDASVQGMSIRDLTIAHLTRPEFALRGEEVP
ncbi:MAG: DUF1588 domain-containing protein, partial [Myxococcota bacterium]